MHYSRRLNSHLPITNSQPLPIANSQLEVLGSWELEVNKARPLTRALLGEGARALAKRDADLARIHRRLGDPPIWGRRPGFSALVKIILEQQVSLRSAAAMYRRIDQHVGGLSA